MSSDVDHYAVFGNPIAHSKSPIIHTLFAQQTGQAIVYTAELAEIGKFAETARKFLNNNGKGMNVTVPFKEDAFVFADTHTPRALRAGAVNTLIKQHDGKVLGDTTDGVGLVNDLTQNHAISLQNKSILIIGAGGAVRGVLEPILQLQPKELLIANRTADRAVQLARDFSDMGTVSGCGLDDIGGTSYDLVINGTSASLQGELPPLPAGIFNQQASSYDMMYAATATPFMQWSKTNGAENCFDGLGMLVEQAAESFYLWRNVHPDTRPVIAQVRASLQRAG
jgi:shikimate dehydrogenase